MGAVLTERQVARREQVLRAALTLAAGGGYDAVQMRDVASEARVALGTLYRYFSSKDQLLVAALGQWAHELQQRLGTRPPRGEAPADRVTDVLRRATRALEKEPRLTAALVTALSNLRADDPKALAYAREVYGTLAELITDAMDGEEVPERDAAIQVLGQVWFATLVWWVRGWEAEGTMGDALETAVRLLLPGKRARRGT